MKLTLHASVVTFALALAAPAAQAQPQTVETQDGEKLWVILSKDVPREREAFEKLKNVFAVHDLAPWIFTRNVLITTRGIPHSHPILTLTTEDEYFEDDLRQLSAFVHEQIHWFEEKEENEAAVRRAIEKLKARYPEVPVGGGQGARSEYSTYLHLLVNWLTLDAMTELAGEREARRILSTQDHYRWINARVLEDTDAIGAVLAEEGLLLTPGRGLAAGDE